jgi:hypothetical protein
MIKASLRHFPARFALHDSMAPAHLTVGPQRDLIDELTELLPTTDYRNLVLWRLGTNSDELGALKAALKETPGPNMADPTVHRLLGHSALADRDYAAAANHYAAALKRETDETLTPRLLELSRLLNDRSKKMEAPVTLEEP